MSSLAFWHSMRPILRLCVPETKSFFEYWTHKTKNHWRMVDTHSQNGSMIVSQSFLPVKTAHTISLERCDCAAIYLPKMYDQKSLTLRWPSPQRHTYSQWMLNNCMQKCIQSLLAANPSLLCNNICIQMLQCISISHPWPDTLSEW